MLEEPETSRLRFERDVFVSSRGDQRANVVFSPEEYERDFQIKMGAAEAVLAGALYKDSSSTGGRGAPPISRWMSAVKNAKLRALPSWDQIINAEADLIRIRQRLQVAKDHAETCLASASAATRAARLDSLQMLFAQHVWPELAASLGHADRSRLHPDPPRSFKTSEEANLGANIQHARNDLGQGNAADNVERGDRALVAAWQTVRDHPDRFDELLFSTRLLAEEAASLHARLGDAAGVTAALGPLVRAYAQEGLTSPDAVRVLGSLGQAMDIERIRRELDDETDRDDRSTLAGQERQLVAARTRLDAGLAEANRRIPTASQHLEEGRDLLEQLMKFSDPAHTDFYRVTHGAAAAAAQEWIRLIGTHLVALGQADPQGAVALGMACLPYTHSRASSANLPMNGVNSQGTWSSGGGWKRICARELRH